MSVTTATTDTVGVSAALAVPIFVNGKFIDTRLESAYTYTATEQAYLVGQASAYARQAGIIDSLLRLSLDTAAVSRNLELARIRADLAEKNAAIARVNWELGHINFSTLDREEKAVYEARLAVRELENSTKQLVSQLAAATGMEADSVHPEAICVPDSLLDTTSDRFSGYSIDVQLAEYTTKAAQMNSILSAVSYAPSLGISGSCSLPGPAALMNGTSGTPAWQATVAVTIPFLTEAGKAGKEAADLRLSAACQDELVAKQQFALKKEALFDAYAAATEREAFRKQIVVQTENRLKEVEYAYKTETATALDVEQARLSVLEARAALEDDRSARFKTELDICSYFSYNPAELLDTISVHETE
jgi:outer membrane protein TolC